MDWKQNLKDNEKLYLVTLTFRVLVKRLESSGVVFDLIVVEKLIELLTECWNGGRVRFAWHERFLVVASFKKLLPNDIKLPVSVILIQVSCQI